MKTKHLVKSLLLASIIPFCSFMVVNDDNTTPEEEKDINFTNNNNQGSDDRRSITPITAYVNSEVLTVHFTVAMSSATVSVSNTLTGSIVSQQSLTPTAGTICTIPVAGLPDGIYTVSVINNVSGESVSGDFEISNSQE